MNNNEVLHKNFNITLHFKNFNISMRTNLLLLTLKVLMTSCEKKTSPEQEAQTKIIIT